MCEAAAEMYKATKENKYLADATAYYEPATAWGYSWNFKQPGCQVIFLYQLLYPQMVITNTQINLIFHFSSLDLFVTV